MSVLPIWAKKPKHRKEVIATDKGWVVKQTGEVLSSYKGLDQKLKELHKEIETIVDDVPESVEPKSEPVDDVGGDTEKEPEQPKQKKTRRGRPPKNADTNTAD